MDIATHLGRSDLFAGLGFDIILLIAKRFERVSCPPGRTIFSEGERGDCFFVLARGEVVVYKGDGICRRELTRLGPGDVFGEMALISNEQRSATIVTTTQTELLRLNQENFTILMDQNERFAQRILRMISKRLRQSQEVATLDLLRAHQGLMISLSELAESRDKDTGAHLYRVRDYCTLLAKLMAQDDRFKDQITSVFIDAIYYVSPLHDIGKVAIPDSILKKQGRLTQAEYDVIKTHTLIGAQSLETVLEYCDLDMFRMAKHLVKSHHECYDGTGYPEGLQGDAIPLEARIMSLADFYDALLSVRVYKEAYSHDRVVQIIRDESGRKFDPAMVDIMLAHIDDFYAIHQEYKGKDAPVTA
jgi:response regulator RpfG family c-di-GMP phosphodiesterase